MSAEPPDDTFPLCDVHGALLAVVPREQEATGSDAARGDADVAPELDIRLGEGAAADVNGLRLGSPHIPLATPARV